MVGYYRLKEFGFRAASSAHVIPAEEFGAIEQATAIITRAEEEAARIIANAQEAREEEKRRGFAEGRRLAQSEAAERLLQENVVLDNRLRKIEQELACLVVTCARKLIDGFDDVARAESIVKSALKSMRREKKAELRVPPALCGHFRQSVARMIEEFPEIELVDVVEDPSLERDRIVVETAIGRVEGDFGKCFEDLEFLVRDVHARAADERAGEGA